MTRKVAGVLYAALVILVLLLIGLPWVLNLVSELAGR
jgi:hypothetical protein